MATTKALTKEQRKHIALRLHNINSTKHTQVISAFNANPENTPPTFVRLVYPNMQEILLKLAGFESPAILKFSGDELRRYLASNSISISHISYPTNKAEADAFSTKTNEINTRREQQVEAKISQIRNHYNRCSDILVLSNDPEYITQVINEFENMEF